MTLNKTQKGHGRDKYLSDTSAMDDKESNTRHLWSHFTGKASLREEIQG